jgi:hypothetical protein
MHIRHNDPMKISETAKSASERSEANPERTNTIPDHDANERTPAEVEATMDPNRISA